jgi:hypothetical protein
MKITLELTPEQVLFLLNQLTPERQTVTPETTGLTEYSKKYLTVDGLQELAKTEYQQYTTQERTILNMANRIRSKELSISATIDPLFVSKNPKLVANTLCNGNARIMVANSFLVRNGFNALTFEDAYIKALKNKGFLKDALSSCNNSLYGSLLSDTIQFTIQTEYKQSNFYNFITSRPNQLIRAWTYKSKNASGSMVDTHATMLFYTGSQCYCVDTAGLNRNTKTPVDIANLTGLHDRVVDHIETLN